jgi:hypothetical protein
MYRLFNTAPLENKKAVILRKEVKLTNGKKYI